LCLQAQQSALIKATGEGQVAVMECLLKGGADINAKGGVSLAQHRCGWGWCGEVGNDCVCFVELLV